MDAFFFEAEGAEDYAALVDAGLAEAEAAEVRPTANSFLFLLFPSERTGGKGSGACGAPLASRSGAEGSLNMFEILGRCGIERRSVGSLYAEARRRGQRQRQEAEARGRGKRQRQEAEARAKRQRVRPQPLGQATGFQPGHRLNQATGLRPGHRP